MVRNRVGCSIVAATAIVVVFAAVVLQTIVFQPWRDPVSVLFPVTRNQTTNVDIPLVLPRGVYYVQILFDRKYVESLEHVALSGSVEISADGFRVYHTEIKLDLKPEDIRRAIADALECEEIARQSKNGDRNLPYPWTTIIPGTLSLPQFPPFHIPDKNKVLNLRINVVSKDTPMPGGTTESASPLAIRIDSFYDAI